MNSAIASLGASKGEPAPTFDQLRSACYGVCRKFIHAPSDVRAPKRPANDLVDVAAAAYLAVRVENEEIGVTK